MDNEYRKVAKDTGQARAVKAAICRSLKIQIIQSEQIVKEKLADDS